MEKKVVKLLMNTFLPSKCKSSMKSTWNNKNINEELLDSLNNL